VMTDVSLGTNGKTASSAEIAKMKTYAQFEPETWSVSDSNTAPRG
jgi:hypothetical protein